MDSAEQPVRYHEAVLAREALDLLDPRGEGLYLDGTVGAGGHALKLLRGCEGCRLLAVDRDPEALEESRRVLAPYRNRVRFLAARFDEATDDAGVRSEGLDGALLDLGVSSHQIDADRRGFTFRPGAPLDMRMEGVGRSAAELLEEESEEELARVFHQYGEERGARRLARSIVARRDRHPIQTSDDLVEVFELSRGGRPAMAKDRARIFQALRIAVNDELASLSAALPKIREALNGGAVLVVIAYHSLEDRIVKHSFREWSRSCVCPPGLPICRCRGRALGALLTRRPVTASEEEVASNPRSRSAKLRAWRKAA